MAASGKTKLQLVNAVLTRLRESTVATTSSTTYSSLILEFVDTVKDEVEAAHYWRDLRNTYTITATPGTTLYTFTSAGQHARILDMWNSTTKAQVSRGAFTSFNQKFFGVDSVATGNVTEFLPAGLDSSYDLQVDVWPSPSTTNTLKANLYIPARALTAVADATVVLAPNQVIIEGALAMAIEERGDDNGTAADKQFARYQNMLASYVAADIGSDESEVAWYPQ